MTNWLRGYGATASNNAGDDVFEGDALLDYDTSSRKKVICGIIGVFSILVVGLVTVFLITLIISQTQGNSNSSLRSKLNYYKALYANSTHSCNIELSSLGERINTLMELIDIETGIYENSTVCSQAADMSSIINLSIQKINASEQHSSPAWDGCVYTSNEVLNIRNSYNNIRNQIYGDLSLIYWGDFNNWSGTVPNILPSSIGGVCSTCTEVQSLLTQIGHTSGNDFEIDELLLLEAELAYWNSLLTNGYAHILYGDCITSVAPMCHPVSTFSWNVQLILPLLPNPDIEPILLNYLNIYSSVIDNWTNYYKNLINTSSINVHAHVSVLQWTPSINTATQQGLSTRVCPYMSDNNQAVCNNVTTTIDAQNSAFNIQWHDYVRYCATVRLNSDLSLPVDVYTAFTSGKDIDEFTSYSLNASANAVSIIDLIMSSLFNSSFNEYASKSVNLDNTQYFIVGGHDTCKTTIYGSSSCDPDLITQVWRIYGSYWSLPLKGSGSLFFGTNRYNVSYQVGGEYSSIYKKWLTPSRVIIGYDGVNTNGDYVFFSPTLDSYIVKEIAYASISQISSSVACKISNWTNPEWISVSLLAQNIEIGIDYTNYDLASYNTPMGLPTIKGSISSQHTPMQYVGYYSNQLLYTTMILMDISLNTGLVDYNQCISIFLSNGFVKADQYCLFVVSNPGFSLWYRSIEGDMNTLTTYLNNLG